MFTKLNVYFALQEIITPRLHLGSRNCLFKVCGNIDTYFSCNQRFIAHVVTLQSDCINYFIHLSHEMENNNITTLHSRAASSSMQ